VGDQPDGYRNQDTKQEKSTEAPQNDSLLPRGGRLGCTPADTRHTAKRTGADCRNRYVMNKVL
jgi:hypothetical protein